MYLSFPILASTSSLPFAFALVAGFVAVFGILAALLAIEQNHRDRKTIKSAEASLTPKEAWKDANARDDLELRKWFQSLKINDDSCVADVIRVCWSACSGQRAATLNEIHTLVARRERSKFWPKLSGGIATLLLVIGIVGTLTSIHPILKEFQFRVSTSTGKISTGDDPALVNVSDNTEKVNSLLNELGDAFFPSIAALVGTILVVSVRGYYLLNLQRYTLELDRFAIGVVMPKYAPKSLGEEYDEVRDVFKKLATTINDRESKFDAVVVGLEKVVAGIQPSLEALDTTVTKLSTAADTLASKSHSVGTSLTRSLGKKSPLYTAVTGFEDIFKQTNKELERLSGFVDSIFIIQEKIREKSDKTFVAIEKATEKQDKSTAAKLNQIKSTVDTLESLAVQIPEEIGKLSSKRFSEGLKLLDSRLGEVVATQFESSKALNLTLQRETKKVLADSHKELSDGTKSIIADSHSKINQASQDLQKSIGDIAPAVGEIQKAAELISSITHSSSPQYTETAPIRTEASSHMQSHGAPSDLNNSNSEASPPTTPIEDGDGNSFWRKLNPWS